MATATLRDQSGSAGHPVDRARNYGGAVKRIWPFLIPGIVLSAVGLVWTLQGFNVLGGSVMSGSSLWATIGPIVLLAGLVLIGIAIAISRRRGT